MPSRSRKCRHYQQRVENTFSHVTLDTRQLIRLSVRPEPRAQRVSISSELPVPPRARGTAFVSALVGLCLLVIVVLVLLSRWEDN